MMLGNGFFPHMRGGAAWTYLLRDEFSSDLAAGAVNGTLATDGINTRTVTDSESKLSLSSGVLNIAGKTTPAWGNPLLRYPVLSRSAGRLLFCRIVSETAHYGMFGWSTVTSGVINGNAFYFSTQDLVRYDNGGSASTVIANITNGVTYDLAIALRSTGACFFAKGGSWTNWSLLFISSSNSGATLYPTIVNHSLATTIDSVKSADSFLPAPIASDGFSINGISDGLGHAETSGIGSGGGSVSWTQQIGTWGISSGKAVASALSGGIAIATVPSSTKDVYASVKVTRTAGSGGLILRWTDANNHLYAESDGTNTYLKQVLAGATTTLITAAAAYSANAQIVVSLNGNSGRLYYNNALVGSTSSINAGLTATVHGMRVTDTTVELDDFVVYATGASGEYSVLDTI